MAKRRQKGIEASVASGPSTFFYVDNVTKLSYLSLVPTADSDTQYFDATVLGLPRSAPDEEFFDAFSKTITNGNASGIVITADLGKGDGGMLKAIKKYQSKGNICAIMVSPHSIHGANVEIALSTLSGTNGFRDVNTYAERFVKIYLYKSRNDLVIRSIRRKDGTEKIIPKKDIF